MKIMFVENMRLPTEKAHGFQVMRVCSELARLGHEVRLIVPERPNRITESPWTYYGIDPTFEIVRVPVRDWMRFVPFLGALAFTLQTYAFLKAINARLSFEKGDVIYTRDALAVRFFARRGFRVFFSAHRALGRFERRWIARASGVVCNSCGTEESVRKSASVPTIVIENAADPNPYAGEDKARLRAELGLPAGKIALYAGHLYAWKGTDTLIDAGGLLRDVHVILVGGTEADIVRAGERAKAYENVRILGHRPHSEIAKYLAAADVLVLPNSAKSEESAKQTSPIKAYEYMAAGVPIVASDLPSLRRIFPDGTAYFCTPDDPSGFASAIREVLGRPEAARCHAYAALDLSRTRTWEAYAIMLSHHFLSTPRARRPLEKCVR